MTALHHLTRLRTLTIEFEEAPFPDDSQSNLPVDLHAVVPPQAPPLLRHLLIDAGDCSVQISCPALAAGAVVQLRSDRELILTDAATHLVGCRLEIYTWSVQIAHQGRHNDVTGDLMDHLFRWFRECGADCIVLLPARNPESDKCLPVYSFHLELDSGEGQCYGKELDPDGTSEYERKLQLHSMRHGFQFAQSEHDGSVVFTRVA